MDIPELKTVISYNDDGGLIQFTSAQMPYGESKKRFFSIPFTYH
jgi:hypothetical protein